MQLKAVQIKRFCLVLASCAIAVAMAACGSDNDSKSSSTTDSASKPAGKPVKLGMMADLIGLRTNIAAAKAGVEALNKRGGLDGRPVELVVCDDKNDPNVAAGCGRKMVSEKVIAMVGGGSNNGNLLVPLFRNAKLASIGPEVSDSLQQNAKEYFFFTAGDTEALMAAYSGQAGLKTTLFAIDVPGAQALLTPIQNAAKDAGTPLIKTTMVSPSTTDYSPIVQSGKPDEANTAQLVLSPNQEPPLVQTAIANGFSPTWLLDGEPRDSLVKAMGGTIKSAVYPGPFPAISPDSPDPDVRRYVEELKELGGDDADSAREHSSYTEVSGWLAVQVLEQLVKSGDIKQLTAPAVLKALQAVDGLDIPLVKGWIPNATGPNGQRGGNQAFNLIEVNDGKAKTITKAPVTAEDLISGKVKVPAPAAVTG